MKKTAKKSVKVARAKRAKKEKPVVSQTPIDANALYSPLESAQALRVSPRTFEKIVKAKQITPTWVGKGKRMFLGSQLLTYVQRQTGTTAPAA